MKHLLHAGVIGLLLLSYGIKSGHLKYETQTSRGLQYNAWFDDEKKDEAKMSKLTL